MVWLSVLRFNSVLSESSAERVVVLMGLVFKHCFRWVSLVLYLDLSV